MLSRVSQGHRTGWTNKNVAPPGGLEPPTFRLTAERASRLRHGGLSLLRILGHCIRTEESKSAFLFPGESVLMYPLQASLSSVRYGLVVRIPGSHPGGPGSIPGNGKLFERLSSQIAFLSLCVPWMPSRQARTRKKNIASAGNRTRINCLEGSYADHYTTDAVLIVLLPKSQVFQQILPVLCPWARRSTCSSLGDIAQW